MMRVILLFIVSLPTSIVFAQTFGPLQLIDFDIFNVFGVKNGQFLFHQITHEI
jgi:hypothetical protein